MKLSYVKLFQNNYINLNKLKVFISDVLAKGVVNAKDTVNFIWKQKQCYWMLRGLQNKR